MTDHHPRHKHSSRHLCFVNSQNYLRLASRLKPWLRLHLDAEHRVCCLAPTVTAYSKTFCLSTLAGLIIFVCMHMHPPSGNPAIRANTDMVIVELRLGDCWILCVVAHQTFGHYASRYMNWPTGHYIPRCDPGLESIPYSIWIHSSNIRIL